MDLSGGYNATLDTQASDQQRYIQDLKLTYINGQGRNDSPWSQNIEVLLPIRLATGCHDEVVNRLRHLQLLNALSGIKLRYAQLQSLFLFAVGAREHNNLTAHLQSKLNSQMA